jgi:hypothetical protein
MEYNLKKMNVEFNLPTIKYDLSELKEQIELVKQEYSNFEVEESNIPNAKKLRAQLNKLNQALSRKRIDLVKTIKEPISQFENEVKVLEIDVKQTSDHINEQINDFEKKEKEEKKNLIINSDLWKDYMLFNEKWLNKTYALSDIEKELQQQEQHFSNNSLSIATMCQNLKLDSEKYIEMLKSHTPINEILQQIASDRELLNKHSNDTNQEKVKIKENVNEIIKDSQEDTILSYKLEIFGTRMQLKALKQFIEDNGLTYEKI